MPIYWSIKVYVLRINIHITLASWNLNVKSFIFAISFRIVESGVVLQRETVIFLTHQLFLIKKWTVSQLILHVQTVFVMCLRGYFLFQKPTLTFWRRTFFFQILAHPVFKMWVIQKPNKVALWNKWHFEEKKMEIIQHV